MLAPNFLNYHYTYDKNNIFAQILRKEISCKIVCETLHTLAFHDIYPVAPVHIVIIPKGSYITADHFFNQASSEEILDWSRMLAQVITTMEIAQSGYRLVTNAGKDGGQVIPHFHMHLLGKKTLGAIG